MTEVEKIIPIPGADKRIYGLLREVPGAPIVVLVHGITADMNCVQLYLAARALEQADFTSYRFDLYGWDLDARDLLECTVDVHADDLDVVVDALRKEQPERPVSVIGHSLGGLAVLASKARAFDAAVLWDASHDRGWDKDTFEDVRLTWEPTLGCYRMRHGVDCLVSEAMLRSWRGRDCNALIEAFDKPVKIIAAGANDFMLDWERAYYERANEPKALAVITDADHNFFTGETMTDLFAETIDWLDQHGR